MKSTKFIGGNQGNLLYQFATHRALVSDDVVVSTISYGKFQNGSVEERAEWINSECDRLVLPLSSSFRLQNLKGLNEWADLIERLTIPVTVVGIGAQLRIESVREGSFKPSRVTGVTAKAAQIEEHEAAARRFVASVLDRSTSIGVRGDISKAYLEYLGFPAEQIDVIGCPSIFMWGPNFQVPTSPPILKQSSKVSLSFDHRIDSTASILDQAVRDYPKSTVYMQEKLGIQMLITGDDTRPDWTGDSRFPVEVSHPLFAQGRLEYCPTGWSWIRHLGRSDFACGPRLHGTVAAILGKTPGHLLVHDSRTLEVAEHHHIPHTLTENLNESTTLASLAENTDFSAFNSAYPEMLENFVGFLNRNSLDAGYMQPSAALRTFDEAIENLANVQGVGAAGTQVTPTQRFMGRVKKAFGN